MMAELFQIFKVSCAQTDSSGFSEAEHIPESDGMKGTQRSRMAQSRWKKAIHQQVLLLRMEKENRKLQGLCNPKPPINPTLMNREHNISHCTKRPLIQIIVINMLARALLPLPLDTIRKSFNSIF